MTNTPQPALLVAAAAPASARFLIRRARPADAAAFVRLMAALFDYADQWAQLLRVELTVFTDNLGAIALYRSFGFSRTRWVKRPG